MTTAKPADGETTPIAYLCSEYPAISHTFVQREVLALRALGVEVRTFTVRRTPQNALLAPVDRDEADRTEHLLPTSLWRMMHAWGRLLSRPRGREAVRRGARTAWRMRRPGLKGTVWQVFYLNEAVLLWASCSRHGIRHIHAHFANVAADVALLATAVGTELEPGREWSWSFTMHGPSELWNVDRHRLRDKVEQARFVACISDFARSQLMALTDTSQWDRLHVVRCGIDPREYEFGARDGARGNTVNVLNIGRLASAKAQALLVDLVTELRRRGCDVTVDIIGDGPERPALERRIRDSGNGDRVRLLGAVGQDLVPTHLRNADIFVLPSFAEGVPVVLMEAMASYLPVVATRIAGVSELVQDGVSGMLVTPGRLDQLADAVESLARDPKIRALMGAQAREAVLNRYDSAEQAAILATLFVRSWPSATVTSDGGN